MAGIIKLSYDLSDVDDFILEAYRQVFAFLAQLGQSAYETAVQEGKQYYRKLEEFIGICHINGR